MSELRISDLHVDVRANGGDLAILQDNGAAGNLGANHGNNVCADNGNN